MAEPDCKIKTGMGGSRCGRNRWDYTSTLKNGSKKRRRQQGKEEAIYYEEAAEIPEDIFQNINNIIPKRWQKEEKNLKRSMKKKEKTNLGISCKLQKKK